MSELEKWLGEGSAMLPWLTDIAINIVIGLVILLVGKYIASKISRWCENRMLKASVDRAVAGFTSSILYALMFAGVVLMALGQVGVQTTSFIAILGAAGLAVGLALQGSLSNFASGVLIILLRPFRAGDFIDGGGQMGTVDRIELFHTYLKTPDNRVIIIPNSSIMNGSIVNYSREATRRLDLVVGISYDADIRLAKSIMEEIINADERILKEPKYLVAVSELADSSVNFFVRPWVNAGDYWTVRADLLEKFKYAFDEQGVGIPYPQMDVHLHNKEA
ncbi:Small-conductance mechanosensitive channel [Marinomonas spartinae]|uniref:Small-conductance mechanosensitive channel n=1 Tax=Marinomonas spartinae TaxID=1792290 RepID=A0A1A8TR62_9GAMM|nr:mechanosensitive ion channel domain-containing protein [Marinomonas spartinae]SBS35065.1 Small-conductance mechanosensitive channel [Marinomonas spartinae]SBS36525.1 Small-conductance mechanosensitive channel [Marinomonas spartinae]